jgi:putative DNA-invertase from lambdoid prophage Rac
MTHRAQRQTSPDLPRVYGYARVSTDNQAENGHSLADQEQRIRGYAQSIGLAVDAVFVEGGVSGGKQFSRRPKGAELLKTARPGDHVIATKLDRIFRSAVDALNVAADFRDKGIHLHLLDIGGEVTGSGAAKLVFQVLAAVAEMERERIGERVRSVKQHLRESGYFTGGHTACGFVVTDEGKLVPQDGWQDCLDAMKQWRAEGMSYRAIADAAIEEFAVRVDYSTVYRILNGKRELDRSAA